MIGETIAHYRVTAKLGEGGMGEVYRAKDTKLDREVAIKILPENFAQDSGRMVRFEREAKVLASLNHPNIAHIYGVEDRALVMELVEGESPKGPMPFEDAWSIASQIADALEYAHEHGVVHRDLKPANVKVTPDGVVKLLDFGLAKAFSDTQDSPSGDPVNSPTITLGATAVGTIMGTAAYMAPEQAKGKRVDKRADIWSWGVMLYELITGERMFKGEDAADTLAQVLTKEPELERVPRQARKLLGRCLEKDPKRRLRDIGEARFLLESGTEVPTQAEARTTKLPWAVAAVLAIIAAAWVAWRVTRPAPHAFQPLLRFDVNLGPEVSLGSIVGPDVILSPDGTRLVYVSRGHLFTRRMDQPAGTELAGTDGAYSPFFSPDGQWIAFFAQGSLKKISVDGGVPIVLCEAPGNSRGGSWGEDGKIILALSTAGVLSSIASSGGTPTPLTELDPQRQEITHRWPQVLPGSKAVLFTAHKGTTAFDGASIEVFSLADRRRTMLARGTYGRYLPSGHLTYVSQGVLFAVPFDLDHLEVRGAAVPLVEQIAYSQQYGSAQLDFSKNGTLVYRASGTAGELATIQWLDNAGNTQPLLGRPGRYSRFRFSPDGERLAVNLTEASNQDVWIYELRHDKLARLTFGLTTLVPVWTPDSRFIVFLQPGGIFWTRSDGATPQLFLSGQNNIPISFTPDGKRLAYSVINSGTGYDIFTVAVESGESGPRAGKPEVFRQTPFNEMHPNFAPDGRWIAYDSNESGRTEVYVRAFPDRGRQWQVSYEGGLQPTFSKNGRELFFHTEDNRIMVAAYSNKGDSFVPDKPRVWSERRTLDTGFAMPSYDLAPDGKRVAVLMPAEGLQAQQAQSHVVILLNFFDEVRRRVSAGAGR
jgi:serine/threonine-protein kinase